MKNKKKEKNLMSGLTWAIFQPIGFWRVIKQLPHDIWVFFYRIGFLLKHGYSEPAIWETDCWFVEWAIDVISYYRYKGIGVPVITDYDLNDPEGDKANQEAWYKILDTMLEHLQVMKNEDIDSDKYQEAKEKFFELFSLYFNRFWQ